jgi:hypothetical protein
MVSFVRDRRTDAEIFAVSLLYQTVSISYHTVCYYSVLRTIDLKEQQENKLTPRSKRCERGIRECRLELVGEYGIAGTLYFPPWFDVADDTAFESGLYCRRSSAR